jgi:alpha-glucuronidase
LLALALATLTAGTARAEDGYRLWLRYERVSDPALHTAYAGALQEIVMTSNTPTLVAARDELVRGLRGLLGADVPVAAQATRSGTVLLGTPAGRPEIAALGLDGPLTQAGEEGYVLRSRSTPTGTTVVVAANHDIGVLYGTFALLRRLQMHEPLAGLDEVRAPKIQRRLLDHWDNLNRTIERGYAGFSLWDWFQLPDYVSPRYRDYARANASIGINGAVLTNVNADALVLTAPWLRKVAALAEVFRPYGIRVYLTARFSAPLEIGGLKTADPLDPGVQAWWHHKVDEIYQLIPDFGGFLVKANSEGQPGPQDYGRNHADGANTLADALAPHGGIVMWRAFVYDQHVPDDRAKQAYNEFKPLDGKFRPNVLVQIKNGPIDFQPREPFHPLFGAMPHTPEMVELQITQEYLGQGPALAYLAPMWKECLDSDTYAEGPGSTVARVIDGSLDHQPLTGIAGVANTGDDRDWCGHPLAAANWYAFGRLAWDHTLGAATIAQEWTRQTFSNNPGVVTPVTAMLLASREAVVNYMTPLGLHHLMATDHHYGPGPWVDNLRPDWNPVYYHRADANGLGFDRTATGSNAVAQYAPEVARRFGNLATCPENLLLWFHHVPWDYRLPSGRTMWDELCLHYQHGVDAVRGWQTTWASLQDLIDAERFAHVAALLRRQECEAQWWRDACLLYFQTFSHRPLPAGVEPPAHPLNYYEAIQLHYVPGTPGGK